VKPPVDEPISRHGPPVGSMAKSWRAPSNFRPPRLTYFPRAAGDFDARLLGEKKREPALSARAAIYGNFAGENHTLRFWRGNRLSRAPTTRAIEALGSGFGPHVSEQRSGATKHQVLCDGAQGDSRASPVRREFGDGSSWPRFMGDFVGAPQSVNCGDTWPSAERCLLPAVLPKAADDSSTSRMSSVTWKAHPMVSPNRRKAPQRHLQALQRRGAPEVTDARISAAVF